MSKPVADMTDAEKNDAITYLRAYRKKQIDSYMTGYAKKRESNIEKGLTSEGKKKIQPWVAAANRMAGIIRNNGSSEDMIAAQMPQWVAAQLAKHVAKCDGGCGFAHTH